MKFPDRGIHLLNRADSEAVHHQRLQSEAKVAVHGEA